MLASFDEDFLKMTEGFITILIFALLTFYLLNYFSQDPQLQEVVSSIFNSITR